MVTQILRAAFRRVWDIVGVVVADFLRRTSDMREVIKEPRVGNWRNMYEGGRQKVPLVSHSLSPTRTEAKTLIPHYYTYR